MKYRILKYFIVLQSAIVLFALGYVALDMKYDLWFSSSLVVVLAVVLYLSIAYFFRKPIIMESKKEKDKFMVKDPWKDAD